MPDASSLAAFVAGLPKVELHVHHVGSASPATVAELAARHAGSTAVPADPALLADYFTFTDFGHFIEVYLSVVDLVRDPEDVVTLTYDIGVAMAAQQVRYAELTVTPWTSVRAGIPAAAFCEAIEEARARVARDTGTELRWIFDIPVRRASRPPRAPSRSPSPSGPDGLVGFGLGGPEVGVPRPQFAPYFDAARAAGLHSVPHAGETTGPQTVRDAIDHLGAERIGHGIAAAQDAGLMALLVERGIPLEVSPTSNLRTGAVASLADHPLPTLVAAGVAVSVNSDDPPMFATTLNREYEVAADLLDLDAAGVADLARAAVRQSFAAPEVATRDPGRDRRVRRGARPR